MLNSFFSALSISIPLFFFGLLIIGVSQVIFKDKNKYAIGIVLGFFIFLIMTFMLFIPETPMGQAYSEWVVERLK